VLNCNSYFVCVIKEMFCGIIVFNLLYQCILLCIARYILDFAFYVNKPM